MKSRLYYMYSIFNRPLQYSSLFHILSSNLGIVYSYAYNIMSERNVKL